MVDCGVVEPGDGLALSQRLELIFSELTVRLAEIQPDHVFLESIFHHKSSQSALVLGHARGVALLAAARAAHQVGEINPMEVKKAVTGTGRAEKLQVQEMVRVLLGLPEKAQADASDALAIAIAGAAVQKWNTLTTLAPKAPRARKRVAR